MGVYCFIIVENLILFLSLHTTEKTHTVVALNSKVLTIKLCSMVRPLIKL